jgi:hypothetical protein
MLCKRRQASGESLLRSLDGTWGADAIRHYHRKDWQAYRKEVIELDGGVCVRCKRGPLQGAVLQVHHKQYLPGKLPWEYPYELCETLCKGCHAGEHGIVRPFGGWDCVGWDDLGDLSGECELCGNAIRYVFFVQHDKWPSLEVGEICCDHLTETTEASDHMDSVRRLEGRLKRFIHLKRWQATDNGALRIHQKGVSLAVEPVEEEFRLLVNKVRGKRRFPSVVEAKTFAFELFENGQLEAFLKKLKSRH